jgi:hypothetical protein
MLNKLLTGLLILIIGCSSEPKLYTYSKAEEVKIVPETIEKTLDAKVITDSVIITNEVIKYDTITLIKYYPVEKKFYIKAKPDTIKLIKIDTLIVEQPSPLYSKENKHTTSLYERGFFYLIAFIIGVLLTLYWRKK